MAETGDWIRAKPLHWDTKPEDLDPLDGIDEYDLPEPGEVYEGVYLRTDLGDYVQHGVVINGDVLRMIDPSTIEVLKESAEGGSSSDS